MKKLLFVFATYILCCALQCGEPMETETETVAGDEATITWLGCAYFSDHDVSVCFINANDYFCPCYADCIWEGAVDVTLVVKMPAVDSTITLTTNSNPQNLNFSDTLGQKIITFKSIYVEDYCNHQGEYGKYKAVVEVTDL
jgi:hypothetical protein